MKNSAILIIKKVFLTTLLVLPLLSAIIYLSLLIGFKIESIQIKDIQINKLSVKLNEKIDVQIAKIILPQSKNETNTQPPHIDPKVVRNIFLVSYFFGNIEIKELLFQDKIYYGRLLNNNLHVKSEKLDANISIGWNEPRVSFVISNARYQDYNISLKGNGNFNLLDNSYFGNIKAHSDFGKTSLNYDGDLQKVDLFAYDTDLHYDKYDFQSNNTQASIDFKTYDIIFSSSASSFGIRGDVSGSYKNSLLTLSGSNLLTRSLKPLMEVIPIDDSIKEWIYIRPNSTDYLVEKVDLKFDTKNLLFDLGYFKLDAVAAKLETKFKDNLEIIKTPILRARVENGIVQVEALDSEYKEKELDLAITITSLLKPKKDLIVDVTTKEQLTKEFFEIAAAYGVELDFHQVTGSNKTRIVFTIGLDRDYFDFDLFSEIKDARIEINDFPIDFKRLSITKKREDLALTTMFTTAHEQNLSLALKGLYNGKDKILTSQVNIKEYKSFSESITNMKNREIDLDVSWRDGLLVTSKDLATSFYSNNGKYLLNIDSLSPLVQDSFLLQQFSIFDGNISLEGDGKSLLAKANLESNNSVLMNKDRHIDTIKIEYLNRDSFTDLNINKKINLNMDNNKSSIYVSNIDINATQLFNFYEKFPKTNNSDSPTNISVNGYKSDIIFNKNRLTSDWYNVNITDKETTFTLEKKNSKVFVKRAGNELTIRGKSLDSEFTSNLADIEVLGDKGYWNIIGFGNIENNEVYGVIKIKDMTVKQATGVMNIIAILNTVPSLLQFKSPGFTSEGYAIENGIVDFYFGQDKVYFKAIRLIGVSTDIIGQGTVDLNTKKLDLVLSINTIKGLSNIVGNIPILGYLLLDKEKTIGTVVEVKGTLDDPKVNTNVTEDILLYPFQVVKRILLLPKHLLLDDDEEQEEGDFSK